MRSPRLIAFTACLGAMTFCLSAAEPALAPTPPMGWNSWDAYGLTVTEAEYRENAAYLAKNLKQFGWNYAVVDEGWYLAGPSAEQTSSHFVMGSGGRYLPNTDRYPSAKSGKGFRPMAAYAHSLGLKFGIHIIRGIPKDAVAKNVRIANSSFTAAEAADASDICPWNSYNYGVKNTPAGQAYYDSIAALYASWDIDFLKVDCIASHPYKPDEIRMMSEALRKTGKPIVLSLSPGPAPVDSARDLERYSEMWRISDDVWDHWKHDATMAFSQSISEQFATAAKWQGLVSSGHWPDADMLPIGFLGPRPGSGRARATRLTHDEQQTLMSGWCVFRSPLILGANLTQIDNATKSLLTNREVIAVNQHSSGNREALNENGLVIWVAKAEAAKGTYVGVFNLSDKPISREIAWSKLGIAGSTVRDLWQQKDLGGEEKLHVKAAPHNSMLYLVH